MPTSTSPPDRAATISIRSAGQAQDALWLEDTAHILSGLRDVGLRNELFANREGAYKLGVLRSAIRCARACASTSVTAGPNGPYGPSHVDPNQALTEQRARSLRHAIEQKAATPDFLLSLSPSAAKPVGASSKSSTRRKGRSDDYAHSIANGASPTSTDGTEPSPS